VKPLPTLINKIEQSLRQNQRNVPLLDMVLMIFIIVFMITKKHKIIMSRDVIFNEKVLYKYQMQEKKHEKENRENTVLDEVRKK